MIIVNAQDVKKYQAANLILNGVTLQLQETEKVALVGRNGSGKSTLLRMLSGFEQPDEGSLTIKKDLRIGYLPQIPSEFEHMTVYDVLAYGYRKLMALKQEITAIERQMASADNAGIPVAMDSLLKLYANALDRFEQGGGYEMDTAIDQVASGLQINRDDDLRPFRSLSGGEKSRVVLASQLVTRPDLLLLDEPTNHLDLRGIEWLEQYLQRYDGACLIVSHDRYFLDAVCSKTIELEDGEAHVYFANYTGYLKEKEERLLQQFALYQEQQKQIKKMKETVRQLEEWGRIGGNEKFFKRAASIRKAIERIETVKRPSLDRKTADFALSPQDRSGRQAIEFEGLTMRYGERVILDGVSGELSYGERIVLLGDNGAGKTTFFKLLLGMLEPDDGRIRQGARLAIGYLAQQEPIQDEKRTVLDYFRTEGGFEEGEARSALAQYLFYGADVFKPLRTLSGGEWSRLRLALLVRRKPNLLLLDEPTNHLDAASREALEEALEAYPGTVLAISHDRYFINRLAGRVWELRDGSLSSYLGNYDDYKERRLTQSCQASGGGSPKDKRTPQSRGQERPPSAAPRDQAEAKDRKNERSREALELEILDLEAKLAHEGEALAAIGDAGDTAQLEAAWRRSEELQARLDGLMELWLKLEE